MQCPRCQHANPAQARFCGQCGTRLEETCPACQAANPPANRFCHQCGAALAPPPAAPRFAEPLAYTPRHLVEKILASRSTLEGERKEVTVLFADLKGSMELLADRDPEEARRLLDPVLERMMEAVHRYEGTVNQVMGDGIMALFGAPLAHEDHAVRACYAALRMQEQVARYGEEVRRATGVPLAIRVGLNSGGVVVRAIGGDLRMDYSAVGQTTHLAARMEQAAVPGSTLLTAATLRLAEGLVRVRALGPIAVKGLPDAVEAYELVGAGPVRSRLQAAAARGLSRLVGREGELAELHQALARAAAGHGQVVAVVGEAGVGKSRLVWEFTRSARTHGWLVLESVSVSYGKATTYLPVIELLRGYFGLAPREDPRTVRERVTGKLLALDRALEPALPALLALLEVAPDDPTWAALDPPQRRRRTLDAVRGLLARESRVQPLVLVFEDLHWVDAATQEILDHLVEGLAAAPILLLVNYRPEYRHGWAGRAGYRQIRLDPLPRESAEALLDELLGPARELSDLRRLLIDRTDGNPLFLEESVHALVETGALVGGRGAYRLGPGHGAIRVPASVFAILSARIDRLPPEEKSLLQTAAVVGKDVPLPLLRAVAGLPDNELWLGLSHLQAAEFLYEVSLFPEPEYTFRHALTHEVAYQSLLQDRQRALHAALLEACERLYAGGPGEHVERLAHHALRGGLWERAVRYLREAAGRTAARSAYREAVAFLEQAQEALGQLGETRESLSEALDVQLALGVALTSLHGAAAPEVERCYARAQELCARLGERARLFPTLWGRWYVHYSRGDLRPARELGDRLLATGRESGDPALLLEGHHALWATLMGAGEAAASRAHAEAGLRLYEPDRHRATAFLYGGHDPGVCARNVLGWVLWDLGDPDLALRRAGEAERLARDLAHPLSTGVALFFSAHLWYWHGDRAAASERLEALASLAGSHGFATWAHAGSVLAARLLVEEGRAGEAVARLRDSLAGAPGWRRVVALCFLAEACRAAGQVEGALEALDEALRLAEAGGVGFRLPEVHRLRGEVLLDQGQVSAAAGCLRDALALARGRGERMLELRATCSLARLLAAEERRDEAREAVAGVLAGFPEGTGSRDLQVARALLAAL